MNFTTITYILAFLIVVAAVAPKQYESLSIEYREATVVVYSLTWTNTIVSGQLKLMD